MASLKKSLRDQYLLLRLDEERALATLPKLIPGDTAARAKTLDAIRRMAMARGEVTDSEKTRLVRIERIFATPSRATKRRLPKAKTNE